MQGVICIFLHVDLHAASHQIAKPNKNAAFFRKHKFKYDIQYVTLI